MNASINLAAESRINRAVAQACSILVCLGAQKRSEFLGVRVEPNAIALSDMHTTMRELTDEAAGEVVEALYRAIDILSGEGR